jgi:hypothetical protein
MFYDQGTGGQPTRTTVVAHHQRQFLIWSLVSQFINPPNEFSQDSYHKTRAGRNRNTNPNLVSNLPQSRRLHKYALALWYRYLFFFNDLSSFLYTSPYGHNFA